MNGSNIPKDFETIKVHEISFTHRDIYNVVDNFYHRIQLDPMLRIPFQSVGDWPEHIQKLTHFWWIRFGGKPYQFNQYNPAAKHFFAGFNRELLERWLMIFNDTLQSHLTPDQAKLWKLISERMGESLTLKNELFRREYESQNIGANRIASKN